MRILAFAVVAVVAAMVAAGVGYFWLQYEKPAAPVSARLQPPQPLVDLPALKAKAEQGDAPAQAQLGKAFASGAAGKLDFKQAAQWYQKAADQGNAQAQGALGELYQAGQGVPRDLQRALKLFRSAADAGDVAAQYDLGFLYEQGQGVAPNRKEAAKWYGLASEGGDPTAQYDYGQRCILGVGLAKDPVEGLKWLLLAAAAGQPDAAGRVKEVESDLSHAQVVEAKQRAAAFVPRKSNK